MIIPATKYWVAGETANAASMNQVRDNFNFLGLNSTGQPAVAAAITTNPSITHAVWFRLDWNSEFYDYDTMHDSVTNPYRLTATTAGIYECEFRVRYQVNMSSFGTHRCFSSMFAINNNGSGTTRGANALFEEGRYADGTSCRDLAEPMTFTICDYFTLLAGDYVECWTRFDGPSAGSANLLGGNFGCYVSVKRVA